MKNCADREGCYPPRPNSEMCRMFHILRKPNSIIVLLFLQNNSRSKNNLKHANLGRCKFIQIIHLYREVQEKKVCSGLQIYSKQQMSFVFMLFLPCFQTIFHRETSKMFRRLFRHFVLTTKTTQPRPRVFTVNGSITCNQAALLTSSVQYGKILFKFGQQQLVMVNYACGFKVARLDFLGRIPPKFEH